jgi:hypothetical protein
VTTVEIYLRDKNGNLISGRTSNTITTTTAGTLGADTIGYIYGSTSIRKSESGATY